MTLFKIKLAPIPYSLTMARAVFVLADDPTSAIAKAEKELKQEINYTSIEVYLKEKEWIDNARLVL